MAARLAVGRWAVVLAAAALLAVPGCSSKPETSQGKTGQPAVKGVSIAPSSSKPEPSQSNTGKAAGEGARIATSGSQAELPKELNLDLGGAVSMKLVLIPAGKFMMGEEKDRHEVTLSKPFYVGVTEVTQAQYQAVMGTNPSNFKGETNPVEMVSWTDATEFCKKLSEKSRQAVRLPTEAEWEYACRAGTATAYSFGDSDSALGDYAWYESNSGSTPHPVGQKKPNAWGLYDMHGNVWEWCADWDVDYPKGAVTDPQGAASGSRRLLRGGSWFISSDGCSAATRSRIGPGSRGSSLGFRVVVSLSAPGFSSEPVAPAPIQKAESPAVATPADGTVPAWAKVSQLQIDSARKVGVPVAKELDLGGGVKMKLVLIPAGKFMMGSPATEKYRDKDEVQHEVTISKPFHMGITHVTVDQFAAFVKDSGYKTDAEKDGWSLGLEIKDGTLTLKKADGCSWRNPSFDQKGDHPVVQVSWNDARAFCDWLSKKSGKTVVLPTESQWEYACRAGTKTAYLWGDNPDDGKGWANCADQSLKKKLPNVPAAQAFFNWDDGFVFTSPVASFKANAFGLYDMTGNVWQWCGDWYGDYPGGAVTDPTGPVSGSLRVLRGGGWGGDPNDCRAALRFWDNPVSRYHYCGFRVVVSVAGVDLK